MRKRAFRQSLCFVVTISAAKRSFGYWQLASVVLNEGDEANTTNLCQKCFNKHLQAREEKPLSNVQWRHGGGKEGVSWKNVEK